MISWIWCVIIVSIQCFRRLDSRLEEIGAEPRCRALTAPRRAAVTNPFPEPPAGALGGCEIANAFLVGQWMRLRQRLSRVRAFKPGALCRQREFVSHSDPLCRISQLESALL
ncbi:hypothetical protein BDV18DRAFT_128840 [Aspergillus unguis]